MQHLPNAPLSIEDIFAVPESQRRLDRGMAAKKTGETIAVSWQDNRNSEMSKGMATAPIFLDSLGQRMPVEDLTQ